MFEAARKPHRLTNDQHNAMIDLRGDFMTKYQNSYNDAHDTDVAKLYGGQILTYYLLLSLYMTLSLILMTYLMSQISILIVVVRTFFRFSRLGLARGVDLVSGVVFLDLSFHSFSFRLSGCSTIH